MKRFVVALAMATLAFAPAAHADEEGWLWLQQNVPIVPTEKPTLPRVNLRVFGDLRVNRRSDGFHIGALRAGPLMYLSDNVYLAVQPSVWIIHRPGGGLANEIHYEVEPGFSGNIGPIGIFDRNVFELHDFGDGEPPGNAYFYRNMLRFAYQSNDWRWIPTLWDEIYVDVERPALTENRAAAGIGYVWDDQTRIELGYMFRSRETLTTYAADHVLYLYLYLDVPRISSASPPPGPLPKK